MATAEPTGTVTFLFTDVEGSTSLWERDADAMAKALQVHDVVLRESVARFGGYVFTTAGDSFAVAFDRADHAINAAVDAQRGLVAAPWPTGVALLVRMGAHTGETTERDGDYFGSAVNRAARLMSAAHGGQIVVSQATHDVSGASTDWTYDDIGVHRLKDLSAAQRVFQVTADGLEADFAALRSIDSARHNLPVLSDALVGRDEVRGELAALVRERPLVTVVGVGGIGKTRLSLDVAADAVGEFDDGVWLCELANVSDADSVEHAAAQAMGVRQHPDRSPAESIAEYCRRRRLLIVLDNCEHVLDGAADLVETVLAVAPDATVLANSREALGVRNEFTVPLGPLESETRTSAAVELFLERVAAVRPAQTLSDDELAAAHAICDRLDGVPLALELAASRSRSMTLVDIEEHLADAFRSLRGSRRGVERHRTLQAAIDWSYAPLEDPLRRLFERLAVFAGGFDLDAVQTVCSNGDSGIGAVPMVDLLDELVAKSMVTADTSGVHARYRLLEPLRQYAEDRLAQHGGANELRDLHLDHYTRWLEDWHDRLFYEEHAWRQATGTEFANLRTAFDWAANNDDVDSAARIVAAVSPWLSFALEHEVGDWAQRVLAIGGIEAHRLGQTVASCAMTSAWWLNDLPRVEELIATAKAMPTFRPDQFESSTIRSIVLRNRGDRSGALEILKRARPEGLFNRVNHYWFLGQEVAARVELDLDLAQACLDELISDSAATGSSIIRSRAAYVDAMMMLSRGEVPAGVERFREAIDLARRADFEFGAHIVALPLAMGLAALGDVHDADLHYFADTLREQVDRGQTLDLWLTLTGAAMLARCEQQYVRLALDIYAGLLATPWAGSPWLEMVEDVLGVEPGTSPHADADVDDLVERAVAAMEQMSIELNEKWPPA